MKVLLEAIEAAERGGFENVEGFLLVGDQFNQVAAAAIERVHEQAHAGRVAGLGRGGVLFQHAAKAVFVTCLQAFESEFGVLHECFSGYLALLTNYMFWFTHVKINVSHANVPMLSWSYATFERAISAGGGGPFALGGDSSSAACSPAGCHCPPGAGAVVGAFCAGVRRSDGTGATGGCRAGEGSDDEPHCGGVEALRTGQD